MGRVPGALFGGNFLRVAIFHRKKILWVWENVQEMFEALFGGCNFGRIVGSGCPDPPMQYYKSLFVEAVITATLVNTYTHTHTHTQRQTAFDHL